MEGQQRSDQNNLYLKIDEQQLEMKYNQFYAELEILSSQPASSDFDNLELKLNQRIHENYYDIYCQIESDLDHIRRNPHVADIPTVYLGTCIKTEHLPLRRSSILDQCDQQYKINKRNDKVNLSREEDEATYLRQNQSEAKSRIGINLHQKKIQNDLLNNTQLQRSSHTISILCRDKSRNSKIKILPYQTKWKTDYITIKKEEFLNIQTKQRKKMHQRWRFSKIYEKQNNTIKKVGDFQVQNHDPQLYQRIVQILKCNENLCNYSNNSCSGKGGHINLGNNNQGLNLKGLKVYNGSVQEINENGEEKYYSCNDSIGSRKRQRSKRVSKQNSKEDDLQYAYKQKYKYPCRNHVLENEINHFQNRYKQQFQQEEKRNLSQAQNINNSLKQSQMLQ